MQVKEQGPKHLLKSLENRMKVIQKLLNIYAIYLPKNKLTNIGLEAADKMQIEIDQLKELLSQSLGKIDNNDNLISLEQWKDSLESSKEKLSEMSIFNIDILTHPVPKTYVDTSLDDLMHLIGLYFEEVAMTGATLMKIELAGNEKQLNISFCDDGDGSIDIQSENITKLKDLLKQKDIKNKIQSIHEVGSNLTLNIKSAA